MERTERRGTGIVVSAALVLGLAGCYQQTFHVGAGAPHGRIVYERWEHFWLSGLVGDHEYDIRELCPSGDATIESYQSFLNGLVTGLTSGIYSPTTLKIRCRGGRRAEVELDDKAVERIVLDEAFLEAVARNLPERLEEVQEAQDALLDR